IRPAGRVVELPVAGERSLRSVRLAEPEVEVVADLPGEDDPAIGSWGRRAQGQSPAVVRQLPLLARGELELPEGCSVGVAPDEDVTRAGGVDPSAECVRRLPGAEEPAVAGIQLEELGSSVPVDAHVGEDEVEPRGAPIEGEAAHRERAGGDVGAAGPEPDQRLAEPRGRGRGCGLEARTTNRARG